MRPQGGPEAPCQIAAEYDAKAPGAQGRKPSLHDVRGNVRYRLLLVRDHPAHQGPARVASVDQQPLPAHIGGDRDHTLLAQRDMRRLLPIRQAMTRAAYGHIGDHAEYAVTQRPLEPVHDRQYSDERHDPQCDAHQRGHGYERNKMVAPPGTHIAQADKKLEESCHARPVSSVLPDARAEASRVRLAFREASQTVSASDSKQREPIAERTGLPSPPRLRLRAPSHPTRRTTISRMAPRPTSARRRAKRSGVS